MRITKIAEAMNTSILLSNNNNPNINKNINKTNMKNTITIELGEIRNIDDEKTLTADFIRKSQEKSRKQLQQVDWNKAISEIKNYYGNHKDKNVRAMLQNQLDFVKKQRLFAGK